MKLIKNVKKYLKHLSPILIFLIFSSICFFGWIVCIFLYDINVVVVICAEKKVV